MASFLAFPDVLTGVSSHDFALSLVGILPFQTFTVIVGATAGTLAMQPRHVYSNSQQLAWIILVCSGLGFGIIALVVMWKVVKKELRKELNLSEQQLQTYLHPDDYAQQQGGMEPSIETNYLPPTRTTDESPSSLPLHHQATSSAPAETIIEQEDEEWFWVWA